MKPYCLVILIPVLLCIICNIATAQDSSLAAISAVPSKYFDKISKKSDALTEKINAKTERALLQFKKREQKIKRRLYKIDSLAAGNIFSATQQRYKQLEERLNGPRKITQYIPFLDTLKTSLKFLEKNKELLAKTGDMRQRLDGVMNKVNGLEDQLQKAEQVKQFLREQKQFLKQQLGKFGFAKQLKKLNKDVYYYSQQLTEYRETIKDPVKIERKVIDVISRTKVFQDFMRKNSMLASLFRMPADDPNDPAYLQSLAGLQTRAQVSELIISQFGTSSSTALSQLQASVQQAQGQFQQWRNQVNQNGARSSDGEMPDFRPNSQRTKSFWKRWEVGTTMQSQRSNALLPVSSDIGATAGFKMNDRSIAGIGAGYKMGWGKDIRHIKISHQGVSLRSFIDYKWKKSLWLSAGFEMNYYSEFKSIEQLKGVNAWQKSGLIGLSKKLSVNTKFFKSTKVQILWDYLSYQQIPRTRPLVIRLGYNFQ